MKKIILISLVFLALLNVQWHYDRMCATVYSTGAYFKLDGVYCEVNQPGVEFRLNELLERHARVQEQIDCRAANPDKEYMCDPRWIPQPDKRSG